MTKRLLTLLLLGVLASAPALHSQLASLQPKSMELLNVPSNGNKALAYVEISFSQPLPGVKVNYDNVSKAYKDKENTPTTVWARVIADAPANRGAFAKSITISHPDYLPCVMIFEELGLKETVKPGLTYRINVDLPDADLVKAHRAFSDLDYDAARTYYSDYIAAGGEMSALASQRIAMMDKLQKHLDYLNDNSASTDRSTRIRMMKCAKDIYDLTSSMEAYSRYRDLRSQLVKRRGSTDLDGASTITVDSMWLDMTNTEARSDVTFNGGPYSWILVKLELDNVEFEADGLFSEPENRGVDYRLRVYSGQEGPRKIVVHHPDCAPTVIDFQSLGITEIKPKSVYNIVLTAPPATVMEADRAFSNLDFNSAQMLYADILQNSEQYPPMVVSMVSKRLSDVNRLVDRDFRTTWRRLRDFFVKRPTATREELAARADSLAAMSKELMTLNVPGMENNVKHYTDRAREYRNSIFLKFSVAEVNKRGEILVGDDGNPKPIGARSLILEFKIPKTKYTYPIKANIASPGTFAVFLPERVSQALASGSEVEVILKDPSSRKKYDIQAGKKDHFKIALEDTSDRSISANIYAKPLSEK